MIRKPNRRDFLKLAAMAGVSTLGLPFPRRVARASSSGRLNIVMITTDQERLRTAFPDAVYFPNRERIMERGVSFNRYHTSVAPCTPARSTMYTGMHSPNTKMIDNINFDYIGSMSTSIPTLGHMLRAAGYYTAYKGKWHLSDIPPKPGVDTSDALEAYGFSDYNSCGDHHGAPWAGHMHDADTANDVSSWLRDRAPVINQTQPFFLSVNFINPHDIMFYDTDGLLGRSQVARGPVPCLPIPPDPLYLKDWHPSLPTSFYQEDRSTKPAAHDEYDEVTRFVFGSVPDDREDLWKRYVNYYINCQVELDVQIGHVLDALEEYGFGDNTIVIFTADHGEMGGAHRLRQKGPFIYKENLNLPLVIVHPDVSGGVSTNALVSSVDLVPTVMSLAGISESTLRADYPEVIGYDASSSLVQPSAAGARADNAGGVLFTYDALTTVDAEYSKIQATIDRVMPFNPCPRLPLVAPDLTKRGFMRGTFDGRYRFGRYFSPTNFNQPATFDELIASNDLELYDTLTDPDEVNNLAADPYSNVSLIMTMSELLESLIDAEIGADGSDTLPDVTACEPA